MKHFFSLLGRRVSSSQEIFLHHLKKIDNAIKHATGLDDGTGASTRALKKLAFGYANSLTDAEIDAFRNRTLAQQKEFELTRSDKIKTYILKMVGAVALEPNVSHLYIR